MRGLCSNLRSIAEGLAGTLLVRRFQVILHDHLGGYARQNTVAGRLVWGSGGVLLWHGCFSTARESNRVMCNVGRARSSLLMLETRGESTLC